MTPSPNYYAIIPAPVLNHSELSPSAKLAWCHISMAGPDGCPDTNDELGYRFGRPSGDAADWLQELTDADLLLAVDFGDGRRLFANLVSSSAQL